MHGRLKVKTTAAQQEEKRKERKKKLEIFQKALKNALSKITEKKYDKEGLSITKPILTANSDYSSMWNYRKSVFLFLKDIGPKSDVETLLNDELSFIESCLRSNPKSYPTWHQRYFVMLNMKDPDWKKELRLCDLFLQYDGRNFHCWDYRRFVIAHSKHCLEDEINYTNKLIENNFSNYSAWHYRSKLLPKVYPDGADSNRIAEGKLLEELEFVQNAFFTDPNDQSAWLYHKWLLGRGQSKQDILSLLVTRNPPNVTCTLRKPIKLEQCSNAQVRVNDVLQEGVWNASTCNRYAHSWTFSMTHGVEEGSINVSCTIDGITNQCIMHDDECEAVYCAKTNMQTFRDSSSDAKLLVLEDELSSCRELNELEPGKKWVVLTLVLLMKAINPTRYSNEMKELLECLHKIDSERIRYYEDIRSRYAIEECIVHTDLSERKVDLSNKVLTRLCHVEFLTCLTDLDVSNNELRELGENFTSLQSLQVLKANNNKVRKVDGLRNLSSLKVIELNCNEIEHDEDLSCLTSCPCLQSVSLKCNPISNKIVVHQLLNLVL